MDTSLIYGQYVPIVLLCILAIMLYEAAGTVDDEQMSKLPGENSLFHKLRIVSNSLSSDLTTSRSFSVKDVLLQYR